MTVATVEALAIEAQFQDQKIRVLDPVSLLLCKVNLAQTVTRNGGRTSHT